MKTDLSIIAKELFPSEEANYSKLLNSYCTELDAVGGYPVLTLYEAVKKYTPDILSVVNNKENWKNRDGHIFIEYRDFFETFLEFFPILSKDGKCYIDTGAANHKNGKSFRQTENI